MHACMLPESSKARKRIHLRHAPRLPRSITCMDQFTAAAVARPDKPHGLSDLATTDSCRRPQQEKRGPGTSRQAGSHARGPSGNRRACIGT